MAEFATIARPYAEALFKAANAADLDTASEWLNEFAEVAQNAQLLQFASNPKSTNTQVFDLILSVLKATLPEQGKNFLRAVIDNGRLTALPEVAAQFRALKNAQSGFSDAVVHSAYAIDAQALSGLGTLLEKRFGRKLNVTVELAPELIGGIRVVVGDEVLDTSVKARLEQMKVALTV